MIAQEQIKISDFDTFVKDSLDLITFSRELQRLFE